MDGGYSSNIYKEEQQLKSINFNFNGYGKYPNYKNDNLISDIICDQFKIPYKIPQLR